MAILSKTQIDMFMTEGWIVIDHVLSEYERQFLGTWVDEISTKTKEGDKREHYYEEVGGKPQICRTERFLEDHQELNQLITGGAVPEIVASLLGKDVNIYKEKINYKMPGGAGFNPHQDAAAYNSDIAYITCLIAVDNMDEQNGCLQFSKNDPGVLLSFNDSRCITKAENEKINWEFVPLRKGSLLCFTSSLPHRSGPNTSDAAWRAIYLTYNAAEHGNLRNSYYVNREKKIKGSTTKETAMISTIGHFQGKSVK